MFIRYVYIYIDYAAYAIYIYMPYALYANNLQILFLSHNDTSPWLFYAC